MNSFEYINLLEKYNITPNWWCSVEYFEKSNFIIDLQNDIVSIYGDAQLIFPKISLKGEFIGGKFWSDFPEFSGKNFLDYEYIYDPKSFLNMVGKKWMTFRKNSKKFPERIKEDLSYLSGNDLSKNKKEKLLSEWVDNFENIEDANVLVDYVFEGKSQSYLIGESSKDIYGINIWDENFKYLNYRYCICKNIPFLPEYLRYLYYINANKLVNDGGVLGRESLKIFKDRLNPIKVRKVLSSQ